jgi:signal transduction histidine kinase
MQTRPSRMQVRAAIAIGLLLLVGNIWVLSLGEIRLREIAAFIPVVDAMLFVSDLVTAILLFTQAAVFRSRALYALASGYLFTALIAVTHALTFPGAFVSTELLGADLNSTAWLAAFWRAGFAVAISIYAALKTRRPLRFGPPTTGIIAGVGGAVIMATALSTLATRGVDLLPQLLVAPRVWYYPAFVPVNGILIALCLSAIAMLMKGRKSQLDVWLLLSLWTWLSHLLLVVSSSGRFTLAWYFAHAAGLLSHVIVMLALIAQASWTYAQLALTVSARNRERDARLMSMDAVAAAIAHEVRQPLGAIVTNASAGLRWLDRDPPNIEMAMQSLRSNAEQGHRASDLIASMRTVLARQSGEQTMFNLNELVVETALLLDRELTRGNISLQFALDDALPSIVADRVQMQQVLVNIFTNAIQSLTATRGRSRQIAIRSAPLDGQDVLLDVSDNGIGIAAERMDHIFDVFFTTKAKGSGMGLSLCRTIVEKHGGHLWASQREEHGATFHLQLPAAMGLHPDQAGPGRPSKTK